MGQQKPKDGNNGLWRYLDGILRDLTKLLASTPDERTKAQIRGRVLKLLLTDEVENLLDKSD